MTLILTAMTTDLVVQSGDRRVSRAFPLAGDTAYDFAISENKQIIFHACDAVALLGYSGEAYLEGHATDIWLAETVYGRPPDPFQPLVELEAHPNSLSVCLEGIRMTLERAGHPEVLVAATGWTWVTGRVRPFLKLVRSLGARVTVTDERPPLLDIGVPMLPDERSNLERRITGVRMSPSEAIDSLWGSTVEVAARTELVGADCLGVVIPRPQRNRPNVIRTAYRTTGTARVRLQRGSTIFDEPTTFTPWIVGGTAAIPPYCHNVSRAVKLGTFHVIPAPPPTEPGPVVFISVPQPRSDGFSRAKYPTA